MIRQVALGTALLLAACAPERAPGPLPPRTAYVGSKRCADCHATNHARWSGSGHARALAEASPGAVLGPWDDVHFKGASSEAWMSHSGGGFSVRARDEHGQFAAHAVSWVIGGRRMQDPLTILPDGRWQVLPVYFHVTTGEWVDYNEAKQGRVTPDHPFFWTNFRRTANHECLDCHVTGLEVGYRPESHAWSTRFVDAGVGCESCHGPGARHAQTREPDDIVHPRRAGAQAGLAICGQCHGPRNPVFPLLDSAHRFRPGDRYDDFYDAYFITSGGPEVSTDFFADGRPASGSFEYQALLESRCHRLGQATCLTCHTAPHRPHGADELRQRPDDPAPLADQSCRGCHAALFERVAEHSQHRARQAQSCVACHMPRLVPAVLDLEADHSLDVPVPENTVRHGVPNACNLCHTKATPRAMADALSRLWPGAAARQARRLRLADAFDRSRGSATALAQVAVDREEAPGLRGAAAVLLARRDPAQAASLLPPLLADASPTVRARAAAGLGLCRAAGATAALTPLLHDPALLVRETAALTLAGIDPARAEPALRELVADAAGSALPQPHLALALLDGRRGDFQGALSEAQAARSMKPYNVATLIVLADAHARLGQWEAARADLEEALRFDPQDPAVRGRLERIEGR